MHKEPENFIRIFQDVIDPKLREELIAHIKKWFDRGYGFDRQTLGQGLKTQQDDLQIFDIREMDMSEGALPEVIPQMLQECLRAYIEQFDILAKRRLVGWWVKAQMTKAGQGYHDWHFESAQYFQGSRVLAWTLYLNDDYEGGELEFLYYAKRLKFQAGDLVVWPAAFTHTHRGNMVLEGEKLILTGWFELMPNDMHIAQKAVDPPPQG